MSLESTCCLILGRRMGYLWELNEHLKDSEFIQLSTAVKSLFKTHRDSYYGMDNNYDLIIWLYYKNLFRIWTLEIFSNKNLQRIRSK